MRSVSFRLFPCLALLGAVVLSTAAQAEPEEGEKYPMYIEYIGGISFIDNEDIDTADGVALSGEADMATGYVVGGAIGGRLLERFRAEVAVTWNDASVDTFDVQGEPGRAKGGYSILAIMANGYVEFDPRRDLNVEVPLIPFVGAGIGWGLAELDGRNQPGATGSEVADTDSVFVWNILAGVTLPVSEVAEISLTYRYLRAEDLTFKGRLATTPQRFDAEYDAHQATAGFRWKF